MNSSVEDRGPLTPHEQALADALSDVIDAIDAFGRTMEDDPAGIKRDEMFSAIHRARKVLKGA